MNLDLNIKQQNEQEIYIQLIQTDAVSTLLSFLSRIVYNSHSL